MSSINIGMSSSNSEKILEKEEEKEKSETEQNEDEKETKGINLKLGDVIHITDPTNEILNDRSFLIQYIDNEKIILLDTKDFNTIKLKIDPEEEIIIPGTITSIDILYRNDKIGYAKQNNLLPNTWINIYFGGDIPYILTGEITNLEEDMIEIKVYPDNDVLFINFGYQGIPEDLPLPIDNIEIRKAPSDIKNAKEEQGEIEAIEEAIEGVIKAIEGEGAIEEGPDLNALEDNNYIQDLEKEERKTEKINKKRDIIIRADEIYFGRELAPIKQVKEASESEQRYNIDTQTNDLMEDILFKIPYPQRTNKVLNRIHIIVERFKQLRTQFSNVDTYGNVINARIKGVNWKPLVDNLTDFNTLLYWILPIVKNTKKIYMDGPVLDETEYSDIVSFDIDENLREIMQIFEKYKSNSVPDEQNKYITLFSELNPYLCPFEEVNSEMTKDIIHTLEVKRHLNTMVDNLTNFYSSVFYENSIVPSNNDDSGIVQAPPKNNMIHTRRFVSQQYSTGLSRLEITKSIGAPTRVKLTNPDVIEIKSIMTLPENTIRFSHVNLPGTNLLEKAVLNSHFLNYWQLLKQNTDIRNVPIDNLNTELDLNETNFVDAIKNYTMLEGEGEGEEGEEGEILESLSKEEKYKKYLNAFIPKTRVLFQLMKKYIQGKLSITSVVEYLEPFLVYTDDLTYTQFKEMADFVNDRIKEYHKRLTYVKKHFWTLIKLSSLSLRKNASRLENLSDPPFTEHSSPPYFRKTKTNVINAVYDITPKTRPENLTNSEAIAEIISFNFGNVYNYAVSMNNINLMLPENVSAIISEEENKVNTSLKKSEKDNVCVTYNIAKQYPNVDEMEKDNGKIIYFDRNFDKTNYGLLDDNNTAMLDKDIEMAQKTKTPEEYTIFLIEKLQSKFKYSEKDARYMAETLINGMKKVVHGDLAIIHDLGEDKIFYFKRVSNRWEADDTIPQETFANSQDMLCNFQQNCVEVNKKYSIQCETYDLNKKELTKSALDEILKEFDERYQMSKEKLEIEINKKYDYYFGITDRLKSIQNYHIYKYNNAKYKLGTESGHMDKEILASPYLPLMEMVLGQSDFIKRQTDIIRFSQRFTRDAYVNIPDIENEDPHWRYCIKTGLKLLPAFLYALASAFIQNRDNYTNVMDEIIQTNGKISDDGDSWVDEFSGRVIRKRNLDTDEGYTAEGFKDSSRAIMEEDAGETMLKDLKTATGKKTEKEIIKIETPETNMAINIINALSFYMGVNIESEKEFMIKLFNNILPITLPNEDNYLKRIEEAAKANKTLPPYEHVRNSTILYVTASTFLIGIQASIPNVRSRKTFPRCIRSFQGYPFDGPGDLSALKYLSCVLKGLGRATKPWNILEKQKPEFIEGKIRETIDKAFLINPEVMRKFKEKMEYLIATPADVYIPEEHNILKWNEFLPPLHNIKIKGLTNISTEFKVALKNDIKAGLYKQTEKILVIESKIISFSLAIQEKIQNIIDKKKMLLLSASNEPFLENACCNTDPKKNKEETTLQYFGDIDVDILQYNQIVCELTNCMYDIVDITRAPYLFSRENTKNVYPPLGIEFTEETIYRAFIKFCRFQSLLPVNPNLESLCKEKPNYLRVNDTINDKIRKLKQDGRHYTNEQMLRLLELVNRQNIVHVNTSMNIVTPVRKIRDLLERIANLQEDVIPLSLRDNILGILDRYDIAVVEDAEAIIDLKNYLGRTNKEMKAEVFKFINTYANTSKNEKAKIKMILDNLMVWEDMNTARNQEYKISNDSMYSAIQFMKSYLKNIVVTFPEIIINSVNYDNIRIQKYLKLSQNHEGDLKSVVRKYYEDLKKFYSESSLDNILKTIQIKCVNLLLLANETPSLSNILYKGSETYSIFDKRTSLLLFENYFLTALITYINLTDDEEMIVLHKPKKIEYEEDENEEDEEREFQGRKMDNFLNSASTIHQIGDTTTFKKNIANLLTTFLHIMHKHKEKINLSYEEIQDIVFKTSEREKDTFTDRLQSLTKEERALDTILKQNKLGVWGTPKGLVKYDKDTYDEGRENTELFEGIEKSVRKRKNVTDRNFDVEFEEENERRRSEEEINKDVYDISRFQGENNDNDNGEEDADNYYNS